MEEIKFKKVVLFGVDTRILRLLGENDKTYYLPEEDVLQALNK